MLRPYIFRVRQSFTTEDNQFGVQFHLKEIVHGYLEENYIYSAAITNTFPGDELIVMPQTTTTVGLPETRSQKRKHSPASGTSKKKKAIANSNALSIDEAETLSQLQVHQFLYK